MLYFFLKVLGVRKGSHSCVNGWLLSSDWGFQTNLNWTNVHAINLTLVNVTSEDNGFTLTCIAENVVGMSNASVALTVYCKCMPSWKPERYQKEAGMGQIYC